MELVLENIKNNNPVTQKEFEQWAGVLYGTISVSDGDNKQQIQQKEQLLDYLITFLTDYLFSHVWESDEEELKCVDFVSKLQLQKEILQILNGKTKIADVQSSIRSFAKKSQFPVGMR
jgi:hypothetical protein